MYVYLWIYILMYVFISSTLSASSAIELVQSKGLPCLILAKFTKHAPQQLAAATSFDLENFVLFVFVRFLARFGASYLDKPMYVCVSNICMLYMYVVYFNM